MKLYNFFILAQFLLLSLSFSYSQNAMARAEIKKLEVSMRDFMRVRCSLDGEDAFYEWQGKVYSMVPGERARHIFNVIGMSAAICEQSEEDGSWDIITREVQLYQDPKTLKVIHRWVNPWTNETVPVIHVANNPVQNRLPNMILKVDYANKMVTFNQDLPLIYPNVLFGKDQFQDYGDGKYYQAVEMFKFHVPAKELKMNASNIYSIDDVIISWSRVGPWLPWMKMKKVEGYLVYSATGAKVKNFNKLSPVLQDEINERLPLYKKAPKCWLKKKNETSWTYFITYFDNYIKGDRFPISAPFEKDICR
jgi:hypothetical protein